jgi:zinc transport system substrate-binding protein
MRRSIPLTLAAVVLALGAGACDADAAGNDPGRVDVVAAFYPLQYVAQRVGGDAVAVTNLTKPGAEPHDLELSPIQVGQVSDADLILYLKGFQPAVDEAVTQSGGDRAFDAASAVPLLDASAAGHDHAGEEPAGEEHADEPGGKDPHLWLDPTRLATLADAVAKRLATIDPDRAADYSGRATALRADLGRLDREYADGLKSCQRRELVVSHAAFGYLADRYDLEQIGLSGLSPENEPSPRRLAEVTEEAREHKATTIFFETLVSPKVAETIAREIGADTAVLDPLEGLQPGTDGDYLSIMRNNLAALRPALGCG